MCSKFPNCTVYCKVFISFPCFQVQRNTSELGSFLSDLESWTEEMEAKDEQLRTKKKKTEEEDEEPYEVRLQRANAEKERGNEHFRLTLINKTV